MSHFYPLAISVEDALTPGHPVARTRAEAERLSNGKVIHSLETEWLNVSEADLPKMLAKAEATEGSGFVQRYEDSSGAPVLAITYWNLSAKVSETKSKKASASTETVASEAAPAGEDHTDDLYFRSGRTKPRRKSKIDPNQMDLFSEPKD